jgi:putative IMPACT (imprinted ancient) family translation regulator
VSASFQTLAQERRAETRERRSRFIATATPARDDHEARTALDRARNEFPDASHHCWASVIQGRDSDPRERWHDAGEPRGTAGEPILQAIRGADLRDLIVIVTRYFGGTKLGKGGLARAYRAAAARVLEGAPRRASIPCGVLLVDLPLPLDGEARHLVARHAGRVESSDYGEAGRCVLRVSVPRESLRALEGDLRALARGGARIEESDETI